MVSLQPNRMNTGSQTMEEVIADSNAGSSNDAEPILVSVDNNNFKKLRTIPFAIFLIFMSTAIMIATILLTVWKHDKTIFILSVSRSILWILTAQFDSTIRKHHNILRLGGYHKYYRSIIRFNGQAMIVVSGVNTIVMMNYGYKTSYDDKLWINFGAQILETLFLYVLHGLYISCVRQFNKSKPFPDALKGTHSSTGSLGLMQPGANVAELLEKQADLIAYLEDHNQKLSERLYQREHNSSVVTE